MAVSKRTRFEVLRRDNHTCRYCRATDAPLTIDHVTPVALGGTDDPSNLVTACRDCNAGKSSSSPDGALVEDVAKDAVRWSRARAQAAEEFAVDRKARMARARPLLDEWTTWDEHGNNLPIDYVQTVNHWLDRGVDMDSILHAHNIARFNPHVAAANVFAYMGGIIRNWLEAIDTRTAELLASGEAAD